MPRSDDINIERTGKSNSLYRRGRVVRWVHGKGFGFIAPDDGGTDIFVHSTVAGMLDEGDAVEFQEKNGRSGKPEAFDVKVLKEPRGRKGNDRSRQRCAGRNDGRGRTAVRGSDSRGGARGHRLNDKCSDEYEYEYYSEEDNDYKSHECDRQRGGERRDCRRSSPKHDRARSRSHARGDCGIRHRHGGGRARRGGR